MDEAGYRWEGDHLILRVRVQTRVSHNELVGWQNGRLRVRITAPPVAGKANACLCQFLATVFQVPKTRVIMLAGETGRDKRFRIAAPRRLPPGIEPASPAA